MFPQVTFTVLGNSLGYQSQQRVELLNRFSLPTQSKMVRNTQGQLKYLLRFLLGAVEMPTQQPQ